MIFSFIKVHTFIRLIQRRRKYLEPISGPTIITGNDDALLDLGEMWEYTCSITYDSEMEGLSSVTAQDLLGNERTNSAPRLGFLDAIEIYLPLVIR